MARGGRRGRKYTNRRVATELVAVSETIAPKPGGTNFEVQFSKAGEFSGPSGLTYDGDSLELIPLSLIRPSGLKKMCKNLIMRWI